MAEEEGAVVVARIAHLGCDGEEGGCTGIGENNGGHGGDGFVERCASDDLVIGFPDAGCGCCGWAIFDSDGDSDDED